MREHRQGQPEPDKVRPVFLDERQAPVQLPSHVEPLVLERVERVKQTHVDQGQTVTQHVDGYEVDYHGLQQEQGLHDYAKYRVGQQLANALHELRPTATVSVGRVRYVLKCQPPRLKLAIPG